MISNFSGVQIRQHLITRHPLYRSNYTNTGGGEYQSNWLMFSMINGHAGNTDPRIPYYYYRQVPETPGFDSAGNEEVVRMWFGWILCTTTIER